MPFSISDRCNGCIRCLEHCPTDAIVGGRGLLHRIEPSLCIDCGACGVACPASAVFDQHGSLFECATGPMATHTVARVIAERCTGCNDCVIACPFDAIALLLGIGDDDPAHAAVLPLRCVGCAQCELECATGAIEIVHGQSAFVIARPLGA